MLHTPTTRWKSQQEAESIFMEMNGFQIRELLATKSTLSKRDRVIIIRHIDRLRRALGKSMAINVSLAISVGTGIQPARTRQQ
jgi:hypothetical protein